MKEKSIKKQLTLTIIHQSPRVLLGMKKRGFGAGRWNGFGGKVLLGEKIEEAVCRELFEEAGIKAKKIEKMGILEFQFLANKSEILEVHIFKTGDFSGKPTESEEMRPKWFDESEIPFSKMWPDDCFWIPIFLAGKKFKGKFLFGESDVILEQELSEVGEI